LVYQMILRSTTRCLGAAICGRVYDTVRFTRVTVGYLSGEQKGSEMNGLRGGAGGEGRETGKDDADAPCLVDFAAVHLDFEDFTAEVVEGLADDDALAPAGQAVVDGDNVTGLVEKVTTSVPEFLSLPINSERTRKVSSDMIRDRGTKTMRGIGTTRGADKVVES
jgi:hypothetical protein